MIYQSYVSADDSTWRPAEDSSLNGIADTRTILKMSVMMLAVCSPLGPVLAWLWGPFGGSSLHTDSPSRLRCTDSVRLQ